MLRTKTTIADRIIAARKRNKLTRQRLAYLMDTSYTTVYRWEKGQRVPNGNALHRLHKLLGILR